LFRFRSAAGDQTYCQGYGSDEQILKSFFHILSGNTVAAVFWMHKTSASIFSPDALFW
jgi:hypothetical protein